MSDKGPRYRKKLIEVALPLEAINAASAREKSIRHGCALDAQWLPPGGLYGRSVEAIDDEKCRELGFQPGTEAYGNCRLQLEQIRAIERTRK